jgi:hypothetical protein
MRATGRRLPVAGETTQTTESVEVNSPSLTASWSV